MSKHTFIFFIIAFVIIICFVSVYYNFGAKNVVDTDLTNEIIATPDTSSNVNNDYTGRDVDTTTNNDNNSSSGTTNTKNDTNNCKSN